ncbi:oxidoreductase [Lentilactobacillus kosonis]|uniref:Oxidoreductase n=1 Tax=Lentilactobacillus kosonis TaxID=2810561 RepID=A0A401FNL7_9LACO|nr:oxidoreductase [Lentilactobacillus kosonis]
MKFAITAATGNFGQAAIKQVLNLIDTNDQVFAIARNVEKAKGLLPASVEIRQGDYDDAQSMTDAFQGIDRVLFISSQPGGKVARGQQHLNVVNALGQAGVKFVTYTSFPKADTAANPLAADHKLTEDAIKALDIDYSFLRNNWYLENEMAFIQSGANAPIAEYWANGKAGWALEREYAEAAADVLVNENHQAVYEFNGPSSSYADLGEALKQATSNNFEVQQVSQEKYTEDLAKTMDGNHDLAAMLRHSKHRLKMAH